MGSIDNSQGWAPFATRHDTPNYWSGHKGRYAGVIHITEGSFSSAVDWLTKPESGASAHFVIAKDGRIAQLVSIYDSAWANGATWSNGSWYDPQGDATEPPWPHMATDHTNPNWQTIAIEHEGHSGDRWTHQQTLADRLILQWLGMVFPALTPYAVLDTLIGHADISPVNKAFCPGPGADLHAIAIAGNTPFDPLRIATIAGPNGATYSCGSGNYDYYYRSGRNGFFDLGYALGDETPTTDSLGQSVTVMLFERGVLKFIAGGAVQPALLSEATVMGWAP